MNERIYIRLKQIENQISLLSERLYDPNLEISESKRINKKKNKLIKDAQKLRKKINENKT